MDERHLLMWQVVAQPEEVPDILDRAPPGPRKPAARCI